MGLSMVEIGVKGMERDKEEVIDRQIYVDLSTSKHAVKTSFIKIFNHKRLH